jgi:hypothetical protein
LDDDEELVELFGSYVEEHGVLIPWQMCHLTHSLRMMIACNLLTCLTSLTEAVLYRQGVTVSLRL